MPDPGPPGAPGDCPRPGYPRRGCRSHAREPGPPHDADLGQPGAGAGEAITTSSGVYALGLLLFVLLTGSHPYRREFTSPGDAERVICQGEPTQPSARLAMADALEGRRIGEARATSATGLRSVLAGDLDAIVMMALRKEPERRYPSVSHLADDLRRYRQGLPVHACGDSLRYRLSPFVGRNRLPVGAGGAVFLLLVALVGLGIRCDLSCVAHGRALAEEEATTQQVTDFLVRLLQSADPVEGFGDTVRARAILDEGALRLADVEVRHDVRARMMTALARVKRELGQADTARALLGEVLAIRRAALGEEHLQTVWAELDVADALRGGGDPDSARALYELVIPRLRAHGDSGARLLPSALNHLAYLHMTEGEPASAEVL